MEEKVYNRQVNKTGLSLRAIDQKNPERNFKASELDDLLANDDWVQCESCQKWRMLPPEADVDNLPEKWFCKLNIFDPERSTCDAAEKTAGFYSEFFAKRKLLIENEIQAHPDFLVINEKPPSKRKEAEKLAFTKRDKVLSFLIDHMSKPFSECKEMGAFEETTMKCGYGMKVETKLEPTGDKGDSVEKAKISKRGDLKMSKALISKYYFHDSLLKDQTKPKSTQLFQPSDANMSIFGSQSPPDSDKKRHASTISETSIEFICSADEPCLKKPMIID